MDKKYPSLFEASSTDISSSNEISQESVPQELQPLAEKLRPRSLKDVVGQEHLFSEESAFSRMIHSGHLSSFVLWGPPGVGKTTIARLLAQQTNLAFESVSAIFSGVGELKKIFDAAKTRQEMKSKTLSTLLFVDEIHRFNRAQQDAFLPYIENGTLILVGATTENPSFELNGALLSRLQVFTLKLLGTQALEELLDRAEKKQGRCAPLDEEARKLFIEMAGGDGRYLLNMLESLYLLESSHKRLSPEELLKSLQRRSLLYDKNREEHYNLISALHKSIRGSDPQAALYWLLRMLEGGEDPRYIGRRLVRAAVEDIGLADPQALSLALNALTTFERLGSPDGELALSEAALYLALAPKSNKVYESYKRARAFVQKTGSPAPPLPIVNAPRPLMKELGYGSGYQYDHNVKEGVSGQNYWPQELDPVVFYEPSERGEEKKWQDYLKEIQPFFERARKQRAEKKT